MKVHVHGPDGVRTLDLGRQRVRRTCDCPNCGGTCGGADDHHVKGLITKVDGGRKLVVKDSALMVGQKVVADGRVVGVNSGVADIELTDLRVV
jgi:hypothetical protein